MKIPGKADWGVIDENDLDAKWAFDTFIGKSFAEAEAMFERNALYYQEDLQSMPAAVFNFYAPALVKYIISEKAEGDSDGASSFLRMLAWLYEADPQRLSPATAKALMDAARYIAQHQSSYEADRDIYGDFMARYEALCKKTHTP